MGFMIFFMCFSMHFESLLTALKKTDMLFKASLAGSWLGQVPAVVALMQFCGAHLQNVYLGVGIGYLLLFVLYMVPVLKADLDEAAEKAYRENAKKEALTESN
uniref:Major facilitator superfamily (MFS) profile domain-containing protein n=1 Tax=Alexandrium monilatum TaxID=311494 RepID=A0A7S4T2G4_9DINO|mmetsp:Transcript_105847/g.316131  ORF Transcript_105847/g.316131 Transcript_105847/m.316131 type:complete len:103 (+) Transcript_105847:176-484(+)